MVIVSFPDLCHLSYFAHEVSTKVKKKPQFLVGVTSED